MICPDCGSDHVGPAPEFCSDRQSLELEPAPIAAALANLTDAQRELFLIMRAAEVKAEAANRRVRRER